jgi:hypothetical protein
MDGLLRAIAIIIEVLLLALIMRTLLNGVQLTVFDLGLGSRYKKVVSWLLVMVGGMVVVFFIAHLAAFYPTI